MKIEIITIPERMEIAINISLKVSPETFKTLNNVNHNTKKYLVYGGEIKEYVPNILTRSQLNKILAAGGKIKLIVMNSKDMEVINLL